MEWKCELRNEYLFSIPTFSPSDPEWKLERIRVYLDLGKFCFISDRTKTKQKWIPSRLYNPACIPSSPQRKHLDASLPVGSCQPLFREVRAELVITESVGGTVPQLQVQASKTEAELIKRRLEPGVSCFPVGETLNFESVQSGSERAFLTCSLLLCYPPDHSVCFFLSQNTWAM